MPAGPARSLACRLVVGSIVVLGSSLAAGCTLDQSGPPAAQLSAWMTTRRRGAAVGQVEVDSRNIDLAIARHNTPAGACGRSVPS